MKTRTIEEINSKLASGDANVFTAEEFKKAIKNNETPSFDEVDIITCGTCGVMSGTAAIINLIATEPGVFKRAKNIYLNGVPANVGPCPNEWLGSVDLILHGTSKSLENPSYGGGFLLKDLVSGKDIDIKIETIDGEIIESSTNINEIGRAQLVGSRMAFKNYTAFVNPSSEEVSSIFGAIPLIGNLKGLTFSGCGDINPLQNDPERKIIKNGSKLLINGSEGFVIGEGTRSSFDKPNLMITGNIKEMESKYLGGFNTGEGAEVYDTIAIPIPILNEDAYNNVLITNKNIPLTVADIKGRHFPITKTDYSAMWDGYSQRPIFKSSKCEECDICEVERVCPTKSFKNYRFDVSTCFGCGMCVHYCKKDAFEMNTGSVDLEIDNKLHNIPIICRQSDKLRAEKLSSKLKEMILNKEFRL